MSRVSFRNLVPLVIIILLCSMTIAIDFVPIEHTSIEKISQPAATGVLTDSFGGNLFKNETFGGASIEYLNDILQIGQNAYIFVGYTYSFGAPNGDGYYGVLDSNGELLWNATFGGSDFDSMEKVIKATNGDFIMGGHSGSWNAVASDGWITRMTQDRTILWNTTFGGSSNEYIQSIVEAQNGDIIFVGFSNSFGLGDLDGYVGAVNSTGHLIWNYTYGGTNTDRFYGIAPTDDGGYIVSGDTASFGPGTPASNIWYMKINDKGLHQWNYTYGGSDSEQSFEIIETSQGSFAIVGTSRNIDPSGDFLFLNISDSGTQLNYYEYGGNDHDYCVDVIESARGGYALFGYSDSFGGLDDDYYLVRINETGDKVWENYYGTVGDEKAAAVAEIPQGGFIGMGDSNLPGPDIGYVTIIPELHLTDGFMDYSLEYNYPVHIDLNATSKAPVNYWEIDDIELGELTYFQINNQGIISETSTVPVGTYNLRVWGYDSVNHVRNETITIEITDTLDPTWSVPPSNQIVELGDGLSYQLHATDMAGLDQYWVNDTARFNVDATGRVTSIGDLVVGIYGVMVSVNDTHGNILTGAFDVIVRDTTEPQWVVVPGDFTVYVGQPIAYAIAASDLSGIDQITEDSLVFEIVNGELRNSTTLAAGTYEVTITVFDAQGNSISATIDVNVIEYNQQTSSTTTTTITPPVPEPLVDIPPVFWVFLGIIALGTLILGFFIGQRKE